jgi:hypothetical protein
MPDRARRIERITGIRCDHSVDTQAEAAFNQILSETSNSDRALAASHPSAT